MTTNIDFRESGDVEVVFTKMEFIEVRLALHLAIDTYKRVGIQNKPMERLYAELSEDRR